MNWWTEGPILSDTCADGRYTPPQSSCTGVPMRLIGLVLTVTLTLAPLAGEAQQRGKIYRVGFITVTHIPGEEAFFERLRELG
jgi:hypothetical protein